MGYEDQALLASTVAQKGVGDELGNVVVAEGIDSPSTAIDPRVSDFILYGVLNGSFARGPNDPSSNIEPVNNPLPDWTGPVNVSGGAITCQWVSDSGSPSSHNLRFTLSPGAAGDDAYLEQVVPLGGLRSRILTTLLELDVLRVTSTDNAIQFYAGLQYLKADGSVTGTAREGSNVLVADGTLGQTSNDAGVNAAAPADAFYLRIRLGLRRSTAAASASGTYDFVNARMMRGLYYLLLAETSNPGSTAGAIIYQSAGSMWVSPGGSGGSGITPLMVSQPGVEIGTAPRFTSIITPSIGATQNNWAPTGLATCGAIDVTVSAAAVHVTGFSATGFVNGQTFRLNPITNDLILDHASASSTSGNRIACPGAANFTVRAAGGVWLAYDTNLATAQPFRVISP